MIESNPSLDLSVGRADPNRREILGRTPWLREIGRWLRAGYDAIDHSVPPHITALLRTLSVAVAERHREKTRRLTLPETRLVAFQQGPAERWNCDGASRVSAA